MRAITLTIATALAVGAAAISLAGTAAAQPLYGDPYYGTYSYGYPYGGVGVYAYRDETYGPVYGYEGRKGPNPYYRPGVPTTSNSVNRGQPGCAAILGWGNC